MPTEILAAAVLGAAHHWQWVAEHMPWNIGVTVDVWAACVGYCATMGIEVRDAP